MPIRSVKQHSDRGSIKELYNGSNDEEQFPPTTFELRVKSLYENALVTKDQSLIESLGIIPVHSDVKNSVALYRHREYVKQLESKLGNKIELAKQEIAQCFETYDPELAEQILRAELKQFRAQSTITQNEIVKVAGASPSLKRSFRRVIEK